jgi:trk system potassium uptake protein TrkA
MRFVVTGHNDQAYYLIGALVDAGHDVTAICADRRRAERFSEDYPIEVIQGNPTKDYVLDDVDFDDVEAVIAAMDDDADGLVVCQSASRLHHVEKTVCIVENPRNVLLFKRLGVHEVVSGTYWLARAIEHGMQASEVPGMIGVDGD